MTKEFSSGIVILCCLFSYSSSFITPLTYSFNVQVLSMVATDSDIDNLGLTPELITMTKAFSSIPDEKMRYKQLLYMANQLDPIDSNLMVPKNKVPGCLSTVYVDCVPKETEEGIVLDYVGDSDGLLTKGLVALLIRGLSGCTSEQIQRVDPEFINIAKISQSLTPGRNNGFLNMLKVMKEKAAALSVDSFVSIENNEESPDEPLDIITSFEHTEGKPMYNTIMQTLISLKPTKIELVDNSAQHAGHGGSKGLKESGESHFNLTIVAEAFSGLQLVKRHQLIYLILGDIVEKIHTLEISAKSPDEI